MVSRSDSDAPHVVIIGGGFGGMQCARSLRGKPVRVTLVDRNNYHLFTPLLYQVASSLLDPSDIAYPIRSALRGAENVRARVGEVVSADLHQRFVKFADGATLSYDFLVFAQGSTTNFFGLESVSKSAHGLKDLPEALELRNHILHCLESASVEQDQEVRQSWLTFVVVGGGPTGVEYAGALSELARLMLKREFPDLAGDTVRIVLIELQEEILPSFSPSLGAHARKQLEKRGIEVRLKARVENADANGVVLAGGESIASRTLVWAAGVKARDFEISPPITRTRVGRVEVDENLRVKGFEDVFAIGDIASFQQDGKEIPMVAPPAMQAGRHVAKTILGSLQGVAPESFRYWDKGSMATIGRNAGVAETGSLRMTGILGWLAWLGLHLYYLIGFRNRWAVLVRWAYDYFFYDRPVRFILQAKDPIGKK